MISFEESYESPVIKESQAKDEKSETVDPTMKIPFPSPEDVLLSRHVVNERDEKEREDELMWEPALMYMAPPYPLAVQEVHVREERDSFFDEEASVAEIAPPLSDKQFVNVTPEIV